MSNGIALEDLGMSFWNDEDCYSKARGFTVRLVYVLKITDGNVPLARCVNTSSK